MHGVIALHIILLCPILIVIHFLIKHKVAETATIMTIAPIISTPRTPPRIAAVDLMSPV